MSIDKKKYWWLSEYSKCLNLFMDIGFKLYTDYITSGNYPVLEYKYRPSYMTDTHYTLVLFNKSEFRLYIHKNEDGSFVDTPFSISLYQPNQIRFVYEGLYKEFNMEITIQIRKEKIDKLLEI